LAERTFVEDKCGLTERAGRLEEMFVSYTLKIPSLLIDTFRRVGITPSGQYAYTFSFSSLPFHDLGTRLSSSKLIAHLGLTVFKLSIKKELVPPDPLGYWAERHPEQRAKWPQWRRVDLEIEGIVLARFRTAP
jgi:hypothetical protein